MKRYVVYVMYMFMLHKRSGTVGICPHISEPEANQLYYMGMVII